MGKLTAGMLVGLVLFLGAVSSAEAADIPPSKECTQTFKVLFAEYVKTVYGPNATEGNEDKADKALTEALVDAGCLSDSEPLLNELAAKPFTKKCIKASRRAGEYWLKPSVRIKTALLARSVRLAPLNERISKLRSRIRSLDATNSGKERRILLRRFGRLIRVQTRIRDSYAQRIAKIVWPHAYQNYLIFAELLSLRCVDSFVFVREPPKGPAARAVYENKAVILTSVNSIMNRYFPTGSAVEVGSRSLAFR